MLEIDVLGIALVPVDDPLTLHPDVHLNGHQRHQANHVANAVALDKCIGISVETQLHGHRFAKLHRRHVLIRHVPQQARQRIVQADLVAVAAACLEYVQRQASGNG